MKVVGFKHYRIISFAVVIPIAKALSADWIQLQPDVKVSPRRSGHAAFSLENETPFVFGGYAEESGGDDSLKRFVVNDLWKFTGASWSKEECSGDKPGPRLATAIAQIGQKAYLFGGWDPQTAGTGGVILDTVHEFDIKNNKWTMLPGTIPGGPTSRHVTVALPKMGKILLHNHRCQNFVVLFDPVTGTFEEQATSGICPSPRGLHAACALSENKVCVFAGAAQDQTMSNEAFVLDTETWKWSKVDTGDSDCPAERAAPCICRLNDACVVVYGGARATKSGLEPLSDVWALDLRYQKWNQLASHESGPPPRNAATLTEIKCTEKGQKSFLLTGGWHPFKETWDDSFVLRVFE